MCRNYDGKWQAQHRLSLPFSQAVLQAPVRGSLARCAREARSFHCGFFLSTLHPLALRLATLMGATGCVGLLKNVNIRKLRFGA